MRRGIEIHTFASKSLHSSKSSESRAWSRSSPGAEAPHSLIFISKRKKLSQICNENGTFLGGETLVSFAVVGLGSGLDMDKAS